MLGDLVIGSRGSFGDCASSTSGCSTQDEGVFRRVASHALFDLCDAADTLLAPKKVNFAQGSPDLKYSFGVCSKQGKSVKMEDRVIAMDMTGHEKFAQNSRVVLMGVFDGHAGHEAAEYLAMHLPTHLLASPYLKQQEYGEALKQSLLECEEEFMASQCTSGSTALVALMVDQGLFLANVGDCRAVVSDDAEAKPLTRDHKPGSNELEKARLQSMGAHLTSDGYIVLRDHHGTCSDIMLSRALGSAHTKRTPQDSPASPCTPNELPERHALRHLTQHSAASNSSTTPPGADEQSAANGHASAGNGDATTSSNGHHAGQVNGSNGHHAGPAASSNGHHPHNSSATHHLPPKCPSSNGTGSGSFTHTTSLLPPGESLAHRQSLTRPLGPSPMGSGILPEQISGSNVVIPDPELFHYSIHQDSEFLVLASDGLWDKVRNAEAVNRVRRWLSEEGVSPADAAERLADYAIKLDSHDNISVLVLKFSSRPLPGLPHTSNSVLRRARSEVFATKDAPNLAPLQSTKPKLPTILSTHE
mmetsp:Transcript_38537/g.85798  ORF Transcript_38537/g.85798 Transcript_38537/m.85798 type:complete len:531 (+) Transcript_38537:164-1756(+)